MSSLYLQSGNNLLTKTIWLRSLSHPTGLFTDTVHACDDPWFFWISVWCVCVCVCVCACVCGADSMQRSGQHAARRIDTECMPVPQVFFRVVTDTACTMYGFHPSPPPIQLAYMFILLWVKEKALDQQYRQYSLWVLLRRWEWLTIMSFFINHSHNLIIACDILEEFLNTLLH